MTWIFKPNVFAFSFRKERNVWCQRGRSPETCDKLENDNTSSTVDVSVQANRIVISTIWMLQPGLFPAVIKTVTPELPCAHTYVYMHIIYLPIPMRKTMYFWEGNVLVLIIIIAYDTFFKDPKRLFIRNGETPISNHRYVDVTV